MALAPIFHGEITDDGAFVPEGREAERRKDYLRSLRGQRVEFVIRKERTQRSLDQNAYLHAVPAPLLADYWGESIERTKLLILGECFGWSETRGGIRLPLKPSTAALTVEEMSHLIEWLPPWALMEFGVDIPLPNEAEAA